MTESTTATMTLLSPDTPTAAASLQVKNQEQKESHRSLVLQVVIIWHSNNENCMKVTSIWQNAKFISFCWIVTSTEDAKVKWNLRIEMRIRGWVDANEVFIFIFSNKQNYFFLLSPFLLLNFPIWRYHVLFHVCEADWPRDYHLTLYRREIF